MAPAGVHTIWSHPNTIEREPPCLVVPGIDPRIHPKWMAIVKSAFTIICREREKKLFSQHFGKNPAAVRRQARFRKGRLQMVHCVETAAA